MAGATRIEAELVRSYWDDGLLDVLCGLGLMGAGYVWHLGLLALTAVVPAILVPLWTPLRQRLVEPRSGYVEFSRRRHRQWRGQLWQTAAAGVCLLAAVTGALLASSAGAPGSVLSRSVVGLPAGLIAVAMVLAAALTRARRFLAYALVLGSGGAVSIVAAYEPFVPMLAGGLVVTACGGLMLARFLRAPLDPQSEGD